MSVSSISFDKNEHQNSNEINDEPLDPRIQIELERANAATSEINNLETQLHNAQKLFQISFTSYKQRLAMLVKTLGRCIEKARPFYHACQQASQAQLDTQQAAHEYQYSVEFYHTAQENLILAQQHLSESDEHTRQEYVRHATAQVKQAEKEKQRCERIHEERSKRYQEYEHQRITLSRSLKRVITKSKPYFDVKRRAEEDLKKQKLLIDDVAKAISQSKTIYRTALNNLEQISEEIHIKRQNNISIPLPPREPTIGSDQLDQFIEFADLEANEFPSEDLSDQSSEIDLSTPIHSLSITDLPSMLKDRSSNTTNCMPRSLTNIAVSNRLTLLLTKPSSPHFSTQIEERQKTTDAELPAKQINRTEEILLPSTLSRMHKFPSDSNLH